MASDQGSVLEEVAVDVLIQAGDGGGEGAHASDADERNEGHRQSVLDQILTVFATDEAVDSEIELEKEVVHGRPIQY